MGKALEELEGPKAQSRRESKLKKGSVNSRSGKLPERESKGDTRDKVAAAVGMSGRTYEKAKAVVGRGMKSKQDFDAAYIELLREQVRCWKEMAGESLANAMAAAGFKQQVMPDLTMKWARIDVEPDTRPLTDGPLSNRLIRFGGANYQTGEQAGAFFKKLWDKGGIANWASLIHASGSVERAEKYRGIRTNLHKLFQQAGIPWRLDRAGDFVQIKNK